MKIVYVIIFSLLFVCCKKKNNELLENHYGDKTLSEKVQINLPLLDKELTSYSIHCSYKENNGNEFLYAYNNFLHSLDVFDISNKSVSQIQLEKEGEDGVLKKVSGLYVQNTDSIWIFSNGITYLCNHFGKVKNKIKLPLPENGFIFVNANFSVSTSKIYFNEIRNSVFYLTISKLNKNNTYFVYEYLLDTNEFNVYPINGNPKEEKIGSNYGWMQMPNVTYTDQHILYNYPITSNIYCIDVNSGEVKSYGGQSKFTDNIVSELTMPYDFPEGNKHILENVHFFELQYSPGENVYYRLHLNKIKAGSDDEFRKFFNKKDIYMTIFDADFNIVNELKLDSETYGYFNSWGTLNKGFFIAKDNELNLQKNSEMLELDLFQQK